MKTSASIVLKVVALTLIQFVLFALAGMVAQSGASAAPGQADAAGTLLLVCFLHTLVLTYLILRSRWSGFRLIATVAFVFYGVMTFLSLIEAAVFITRLPPGLLPRLFLMGALIAGPFSVLAVLILGKRKPAPDNEPNTRLVMPAGEWVWKLTVIALVYLIVYFTFGYYIAWRVPAVREYYNGIDEGTFFVHMGAVLRDSFWLIPFQALRAMCWVALAVPVIRMMKGRWPETAFAIGLVFAGLMTPQILLPNPYMPDIVRRTHLIETAPSNFLFGWIVGWLLTQRREAGAVATATSGTSTTP